MTAAPALAPAAPVARAPGVVIDETQQKTQIQIRLGDGSRVVATFNHTHTVAHIRQHIEAYVFLFIAYL